MTREVGTFKITDEAQHVKLTNAVALWYPRPQPTGFLHLRACCTVWTKLPRKTAVATWHLQALLPNISTVVNWY